MKRFTITFAVALFIGLVTPTNVTVTPAVETTPAPAENTTASADYSGYAQGWAEQQTKYQNEFAGQADSMGEEYVPETDYSQYQGQTDKYTKKSGKIQGKFQKQTNNWMSYSDASAYGKYQSDYASAYLPK